MRDAAVPSRGHGARVRDDLVDFDAPVGKGLMRRRDELREGISIAGCLAARAVLEISVRQFLQGGTIGNIRAVSRLA